MRCYYIQMGEVAPDAPLIESINHDFVVFAHSKDQARCMVSDAMRNSKNIPCGVTYSMELTRLDELSTYLRGRTIKVLSPTYYPSA